MTKLSVFIEFCDTKGVIAEEHECVLQVLPSVGDYVLLPSLDISTGLVTYCKDKKTYTNEAIVEKRVFPLPDENGTIGFDCLLDCRVVWHPSNSQE